MGGILSDNREEQQREEQQRAERKRAEQERAERERAERERAEQKKVKKDIVGLKNEMEIRSHAYYLCAKYYGRWKFILFVLLLLVSGLLAGLKALDWKMPQAADPMSIILFTLAVAACVIKQCYSRMADTHEKHYKAEINCQSIADRARSASDSNESSSSLKTRYDALLKDKGKSSEIRCDSWAYARASRK